MKKSLSSLALALSCISFGLAQSNEKVVAYFNRHWNQVYDSTAEISYFRTVEAKGANFLVRDYDISQKLRMQTECSAYTPKLVRNGKATSFYENGKIEEEGTYRNDRRTGVFHSFYKSGKPKEDLEYLENDEVRHLTYFTETGEALIVDGSGIITEQTNNGVNYSKIRNYLAVASFSVDLSYDTIYTLVDRIPVYRGGDDRLLADIKSNIRYPKNALKNKLEGTVYVSFVVTRSGSVKDVEIIKGFDEECDVEAMRVVSFLNRWQPGVFENRFVNTRFVLPFQFTLPNGWKKS